MNLSRAYGARLLLHHLPTAFHPPREARGGGPGCRGLTCGRALRRSKRSCLTASTRAQNEKRWLFLLPRKTTARQTVLHEAKNLFDNPACNEFLLHSLGV